MNAQIEKLFEQAAGKEFPTGVESIHPAELKRFAELIIEECASAVNSMDDSCTGFWANIIKEHFGVEDAPVNDVDRILQTVRTRGVEL